MPEYFAPGVYVEEVESGSRPIEGASTSTAGMIGITEWGPDDGAPVMVTSLAEFQRKFGGYLGEEYKQNRYLPYAVEGFFNNGGQKLYIKRVAAEDAEPSWYKPYKGVVTRLTEDITETRPGLRKAKLDNMRGISVDALVTFTEEDKYKKTHANTVKVSGYDKAQKEITFWVEDNSFHSYTSIGASVIIGDAPVEFGNISFTAKSKGSWGKKIKVSIQPVSKAGGSLVSIDSSRREAKLVSKDTALNYKSADAATANTFEVTGAGLSDLKTGDKIAFKKGTTVGAVYTISVVDPVNNKITVVENFEETGLTTTHALLLLTAGRLITSSLKEYRSATNELVVQDSNLFPPSGCVVICDADRKNPQKLWYTSVTNNNTLVLDAAKAVPVKQYIAGSIVYLFIEELQVPLDNAGVLKEKDKVKVVDPTNPGNVLYARIESKIQSTNGVILRFTNPMGLQRPLLADDALLVEELAVEKDSKFMLVDSVNNFYKGAVAEIDNGVESVYKTVSGINEEESMLTFDEEVGIMCTAGDKVKSCEYTITISHIPGKAPSTVEVFEEVSLNKECGNYFADRINRESALVNVTVNHLNIDDNICTSSGLFDSMKGGREGDLDKISDEAFIGKPGAKMGLEALKDIDDISIVSIPGNTSTNVQNALIRHCELFMKYRFAILDTPLENDLAKVKEHKGKLSSSSYGAVYYPWISVYDSLTGKNILVPPSGHIAGIYARSDTQKGVHKAPANEEIKGINGLQRLINKAESGDLNDNRINALMSFTGRGLLVWGARTLASKDNALWKYINVRRLFIFIEKSIDTSTQWVVFEPNNEKLWARVKLSVTEFLTRVWRDGALMGTKPEQAFFVRCDRTTMTQDDIDAGKLIVEIGIAPTKPAEFVIFRITQWYDGVKG